MSLPLIVLSQTLTMALYMAAGFALFKAGKITREGSRDMATLLLWLIIPAVIINSFCVPFSPEKLSRLGWSALLAVVAMLLGIVVSHLLFPKAPVDDFAAAFSNAGFVGIPLVRQSLGEEAVFYLVAFVALLNLLQWTYGASLLRGGKGKGDWKSLLLNPILAGAVIGLVLFLTGAGEALPVELSGAIKGLAALNSPLAMLVLGVYLAQTRLSSLVTTPRLYVLSAVRLILIPLLTLLVLWPLPILTEIRMAILIAASAPVGANVAVYAQIYDQDYPYACQTVALTTLLSILTLPLMAALAQQLFGA